MFVTEWLVSALAPHVCAGCGSEGAVLCEQCLAACAPPLPDRCYRCRRQTGNSAVCESCRPESRITHLWVRTSYEGVVKRLIHDFKFARKQAAARPIARLMKECLPCLSPEIVVTHVPTAPSRIRQRGYDHAGLIAQDLARELGLNYAPLLVRSGKARQVGASRKMRLEQLAGVFSVRRRADLPSKVLLVDDVLTTGGTLEGAAKALKQAGVRHVGAVVFAQKQ